MAIFKALLRAVTTHRGAAQGRSVRGLLPTYGKLSDVGVIR